MRGLARTGVLATWLLIVPGAPVLLRGGPAPGSEVGPETPTEAVRAAIDPDVAGRLEAIHRALVELRFEEAVELADRFVGSADVSQASQLEAVTLRSQARVALGSWDALEGDYLAILALDPGFEPDPKLTPARARERFAKVRSATVGALELHVTPADAWVTVDGRTVERNAEGSMPLLAGEHSLAVWRDGFDPATRTVAVEASATVAVELALVPNARSVILLTEPEGVEVAHDGVVVGITRRTAPGEPARLLLEHLPLGEHIFTFEKPCHRAERLQELLGVELNDNAAQTLGPVRLQAAHSTLRLSGEPVGATVVVDGHELGTLPFESQVCPGEHVLEVRHGGRRIWLSSVRLEDAVTTAIAVAPRPNLVLGGAVPGLPELERLVAGFNTIERDVALPPLGDGTIDWGRVEVPADTDLVLARVAATASGEPGPWFVYSPVLARAVPLDLTRADPRRPPREIASWGFESADSTVGGPVRVVHVVPGGSAAAAGIEAGSRILSLGGAVVERAEQVRGILRTASARAALSVKWTTVAGETVSGSLAATVSPLLEPSRGELAEDVFRAAWAQADSISTDERGQISRAALALLYEAWDRHDAAVLTWRRVQLGERRGIGRGTVQYYLGRAFEHLGRLDEAAAAYREAALSTSTVFHDDGPLVAPAARDHLAELVSRIENP